MRQDLQDPRIIAIIEDPSNKPYRKKLLEIVADLPISVFCNCEISVFDEDNRKRIFCQSDWNIPFLIKYSTCGEGHGHKHIPDVNTLINDFNNKSGADKLRTFWFYFTFPAFEYFP